MFRVLQRSKAAMVRCYEQARQADPATASMYVVRHALGTAGRIAQAKIEGASGALATCMQSQLLRHRGMPLVPTIQSLTLACAFRPASSIPNFPFG